MMLKYVKRFNAIEEVYFKHLLGAFAKISFKGLLTKKSKDHSYTYE